MIKGYFQIGTVALALFFGFCCAEAAEDLRPIKLGFVQPTKSLLGKQAIRGAQVAVQMIADRGGILSGRKIEIVIYDDNFSPVEGVATAQRLIDKDGIKLICGHISSTVSLAVIPVVRAANALYVATVPKHTDVTASGYDKVFRLNSTPVMDGAIFNEVIEKDIRPDKMSYIGENNDFGRQNLAVLKKRFGTKIVSVGFYDVKQSDFSALVTDAKASAADTLFVTGANVEQYANIIRNAYELGYQPKHVVLAAGTLNRKVIELAGQSASGTISVDIYIPSFDSPLNKEFVTAYRNRFGEEPEKIEELNFEAIWILAKAIDKAGTSDDLKAVAKVIRETPWETPRGTVRFDERGQALSRAFPVVVRENTIRQLR